MKAKHLPLLISLVTLTISACSKVNTTNANRIEPKIRTVEISKRHYLDEYFQTSEIVENDDEVTFTGTLIPHKDIFSHFDNVSFNNDDLDDYSVVSTCSFNMKKLQFSSSLSLLDSNDEIIEKESKITNAFITEYGSIDAEIEIEGETYLLSDIRRELHQTELKEEEIEDDSNEDVEECGLILGLLIGGLVAGAVIGGYVAVAETAEQIRCSYNYSYNFDLEQNGNGVEKYNYIYNQLEVNRPGYNSGNYYFGFTTFDKVGCEVASVYNLLIALGKAERLSYTILRFEELCIEYSVGFGSLGSNPKDIYRYLMKNKIGYDKYTSYDKFKKALDKKSSAKAIVSFWNKGDLSEGFHTFYIEKTSNMNINTYNMLCKDSSLLRRKNITAIKNEFDSFIISYIIK